MVRYESERSKSSGSDRIGSEPGLRSGSKVPEFSGLDRDIQKKNKRSLKSVFIDHLNWPWSILRPPRILVCLILSTQKNNTVKTFAFWISGLSLARSCILSLMRTQSPFFQTHWSWKATASYLLLKCQNIFLKKRKKYIKNMWKS
jgi:hypothetical protein